MEWIELGELADIELGKTPARKNSKYWNGTNTWVSISDLNEKYISDSKEKITNIAVEETNIKKVPKGTVIMSFKLSIGKKAITEKDLYTNEAICAFHIIDEKILDKYYLYYVLGFVDLIKDTDKSVKGKTLNKAKIKKIKIPVPPLAIQEQIVEVLDRAQEQIDKRRAQIQAMDSLIESIFYSMFGDPVRNEKGWEVKELKTITNKIGSGSTPRGGESAYKKSGISLIRSMNVYDNKFQYRGLAFIDESQAEKLKNVKVYEDDILINITGASITRCCIVPKKILPAKVNQHVSILRCKENIDKLYLLHLIISNTFKQKIYKISTSGGATREALTKTDLENLEIPIPPLDLQNEFAQKVELIEREKEVLEESLELMEENYRSIMDRAFKGELFN